MPTNRFAETYPCYANITIGPGNGTNAVQSSPAVTVPHRWDAGYASSSAPIAHDLRLDAYVGAVSYYLGTVSIPSGAGYTTVPSVNVINLLVTTPDDGIVLPASAVLRATLAVTLGAGEALVVALVGGSL